MLIKMNFENIKLMLRLIGIGDYEFILNRYIAPISIDEVYHKCPLKSRGVKRNGKLTLLTSLKLREENSMREFNRGDISVNPSSGQITIYLQDNFEISQSENYLGNIGEELNYEMLPTSMGVLIKSI
ncbi:hypothetical protein EB155_04740 [archaeon]|jgi:hypothetical protein|nr:hypothetical protein [archaeon]NDB55322.1 hypothetical protein [archaeon]NDB79154.1 hypothetical protein [archaeon]